MLPVEQASFFTFSGGQKQSRCESQCGKMQVPHESFFRPSLFALTSRLPLSCFRSTEKRQKMTLFRRVKKQ